MEKCELCEYESDNKIKFAKHVLHTHGFKRGDYIIKTKHGGVPPTCSCGCGEETKYMPSLGGFSTYIKKHLKQVQKGLSQTDIFGDMKNPKRIKAISKTRKEKYKSGEYDHIIKSVKKSRLDPELGEKISKGAKGVPKPKPEGFGEGRIHSKLTKEKMSDSHLKNWSIGKIGERQYKTNKLEILFSRILDILDITYESQLYAKDIRAFYDFYIPSRNLIIEVDGDYWHCNPKSKYATPKYESQKKNLIRDKEKNEWAINNGFKIIRFLGNRHP